MTYTYSIDGKKVVQGEVTVGGSEEFTMVAALLSTLASSPITLFNTPSTRAVNQLIDTMTFLGSRVTSSSKSLLIESNHLTTRVLPNARPNTSLVELMLIGVLAGQYGKAAAKIDTSRLSEEALFHVQLWNTFFSHTATDNDGFLNISKKVHVSEYVLPKSFMSLTIHALLLSLLGSGSVTLKNCAQNPVLDTFIQLMNAMGAQIKQEANTISISQVSSLNGIEFSIPGDRYETCFWVVATLMTQGELILDSVPATHIVPFLSKIEQIGGRFKLEQSSLHVWHDNSFLKSTDIALVRERGVDERFALLLLPLLTQSDGVTTIRDTELHTTFEDLDGLGVFGVEIQKEENGVRFFGPTHLKGAEVAVTASSFVDTALLLALGAKGVSTLHLEHELFERYQDFDEKLQNIGLAVKTV